MTRKASVIVNGDLVPNPANPHSWMVLKGDETGREAVPGWRVMFGNLRPVHRGFAPSLSALAAAKIMPAAPAGTPVWQATAHRVEVLLPAFAEDALLDPETLVKRAEAEQPENPRGLATYITLTSNPERLHRQYEICREVARRIVDRLEGALILVQHVPARAASANPPHLHIIVPGPRRLTRFSSFGSFVSELSSDAGRDLIIDELETVLGH